MCARVLNGILVAATVLGLARGACGGDAVARGADAKTPSVAFYFDWINNQYEGTTEAHALVNLEFFRWLHDEYGFALDVYSLDVGNLDDGPFTAGVGRLIPDHCGTLDSAEFRRQFPNGFGPLRDLARSFGCRLGVWLGPDGFGDTPAEERARRDLLVTLCRDFDFRLLKFDACAGGLRPEKEAVFLAAIEECRRYCPDLILLNERIDFGTANACVTTHLWAGEETYIDVFSWNPGTAPHHRAGALARPLTPGLERLIEDHGVCLSSCLDYWEDDLVLQTFNRGTLLAPEIYGSPWLLRDDEFSRLARLCNLYRRYREILVDGTVLPAEQYGPHAIARGDGATRFLTLRNPSWQPVTYRIRLDGSIGLSPAAAVEVRRFHPFERILGRPDWGSEVAVTVDPFRSCLICAATGPPAEVGFSGCDYEVVRDVPGRPVTIRLLGPPGSRASVRLEPGDRRFRSATVGHGPAAGLLAGAAVDVEFPGTPLKSPWFRMLGEPTACPVPADAEALFEATCFAADSNALEVRSLERSGPTRIPQVEAARRAFFEQPMFVRRGIRDRNLFDGEIDTFFLARTPGGALRLDLGQALQLDTLVLRIRDRTEHDLNPALHTFTAGAKAEVSADLSAWAEVSIPTGKGTIAVLRPNAGRPVRYVRIAGAPRRICEIEAYHEGESLDRTRWRASNLLAPYSSRPAAHAWSLSLALPEIPQNATLAIALDGEHGKEGAFAAARVGDRYLGATDRAVSFPSNTWEYRNVQKGSDYTYFVPLDSTCAGEPIEVVVLGLTEESAAIRPTVYLTAYPPPLEAVAVVLSE